MVVDDARGGGAFRATTGPLPAAVGRAEPQAERVRDERLAALRALYDRWSPLVYSFALDRVGAVAEAEGVTQRVFTQAWEADPLPDAASPRAAVWLIGLAGTVIEGSDGVSGSSGAAPEEDLVRGESKSPRLTELLVSDEMSQQGAVREEVLRMALTEHLTSAQIAERTQLPVDDVTHHLTCALSALRDGLVGDDDGAR